MRTSGPRTSARRMTMTTTTITITLKISSSHRIVPRWPGLPLEHLRPHKATQALSRVLPEETLSSLRIRRCRTYLMETAQTSPSRSSEYGRKTCCALTTSKKCERWSSASANTESTRLEAPKAPQLVGRESQMRAL